MAGEDTLEQHYVQAFQDNLGLLPQQKTARLVGRVDAQLNYTKKGDSFNADDMGTASPSEIEDRFGQSPEGVVDKRRRVGFFIPFDDGRFLDDVDNAKSLSDPADPTMMAMRAGLERYRDKAIIDALGGGAREGRNGENTVALPAAQIVAQNSWTYYDLSLAVVPSGNSGLTASKLIEAKVKLDASEIEGGEATMVASAEQLGQLLRDRTLTSADYQSVKAMVNGEVSYALGWTFVKSQQLPKASSVRTCYGFVRNALAYRGRMLKEARIVERPDRRFNWYAYYKGMHGAVRRYDEGVVAVLCAEA